MNKQLNPQKGLIFRIEHVDNLPWDIQQDGFHSRNSAKVNPNYVNIGNPELIDRRSHHPVPIHPHGTLSDYVPFYFTPFSQMMLNIVTGYGGIAKRSKNDIAILVSSIPKIVELGLEFVFTNQHAYAAGTEFYSDPARLDVIDWTILQNRDFKKDDSDPGKGLRYQAEALVYQRVPISAILGICCFSDATKGAIEAVMAPATCDLPVYVRPGMYFN
jgi:hypothetical protein